MSYRKAVTIVEVAKRAGVSNATVSAVLSGSRSNVRVSDATRQRVVDIARQMDYRPNAIARSLRRKRTNVVGFYCGYGYLDTSLPFFAEVIGGLQKGCDAHRKDLLLHGAFPERPIDDIYAELVDGRIDGLVVYAPAQDELVSRLAASHLPVIAIVDPLPDLPSVGVDNAIGARLLVDYLYRQGHRRLLYWHAWRPMVASDRRRDAFCAAAMARDMAVSEWYEADPHAPASSLLCAWREMVPSQRATAVACWNDMTAYRLLAQCRTQGIAAPQELAVTGFDGMPSPFGMAWRLTTIRAPWLEVARTAVSLLVEQHAGEMPPSETVLPVELFAGDTA